MNDEEIFKNLVAECIAMLDSCGILLPPNLECRLNPRLSKDIGRCKRTRKNGQYYYTVEIIKPYFIEYLSCGLTDKIRDNILHELCHTLPNCLDHQENWERYITILNDKYGCHITKHTEIDVSILTAYRKNFKRAYIIQCKTCGEITRWHRKPRCLLDLQSYECAVCGGSLQRIH